MHGYKFLYGEILTKMAIRKIGEASHTWLQFFAWGDLNENCTFKQRKIFMHGYNFLHGYDLNENGNFNENKLVMHGYKTLHRGDLNENGNCKDGKLVMHDYKI